MNYLRSNIKSLKPTNDRVSTSEKIRLWSQKFWRFSRFYGDYLASLHAKKH